MRRATRKQWGAQVTANTRGRVAEAIGRHAEVVRSHDAVHRDQPDCGGFGYCALMRDEHEAAAEVIYLLGRAARMGVTL